MVRVPLGSGATRELAERVLAAERASGVALSIAFVGPAAIRRLNRDHLGRDRETDVIAFALVPRLAGPPVPRMVGDIYICPRVAARQAREHGATHTEELRRLVIHGVLHVLGYDHPDGVGRAGSAMWRRQESLLSRLGKRA